MNIAARYLKKGQTIFNHASRAYVRSNKTGPYTKALGIVGAGLIAGTGLYYQWQHLDPRRLLLATQCSSEVACSQSPATVPDPQPNVVSQPKQHALYLTIHLRPEANVRHALAVVAKLNVLVDRISDPSMRDEEDELLAGVGFGPNFLRRVRPNREPPHSFAFHERKGPLGTMPSTGGDIFIHAKSNQFSGVFELAQSVLNELGGSVERSEDVYGWIYRGGRDLSGFIDGTENPADEEHRSQVALNPVTGGSYVITQKWVHRHRVINSEKDSTMESWMGRKRSDSTELPKKSVTSHVARMTGGANFEQKKQFEIVRQSQPFGSLSGESGLFFIAYSASPTAFEYMLDRMVGASHDGLSDDVMRLTSCERSAYWYFPGKTELHQMAK